jgi:hypothetical protein
MELLQSPILHYLATFLLSPVVVLVGLAELQEQLLIEYFVQVVAAVPAVLHIQLHNHFQQQVIQ